MACDDDLVKCLVFWANFFLALIGISILSVGIIYKITLEELSYAIPKDYQDIVIIPVLIIPIGISLIVLAVVGCYSSLTENVGFVALHCIVLFFIFIIQISVGANAFYEMRNKEDFYGKLNVTLNRVFSNYDNYEYKEVVDLIQHRLKCCGINGSIYWREVPRSCHKNDMNHFYESPCPPLVLEYMTECVHIVGIITLVLSITEIIGSAISLFFVNYLRNQSRKFIFIKTSSFDNEFL